MVNSGVTHVEVGNSLGRALTPAEQTQAATWIKDAETLIGIRLGHDAELDPETLAMVVREAALGRLERASSQNASSITVSADDASVTRRWDENAPRAAGAAWWFRDEWWDWLTPDPDDEPTAAFTIRPGRP